MILLVKGHVEARYSVKKGWTEPQFVDDPYLRIHGMAPGLNYGQQAFEGLKAFRTPDNQIAIFRPTQNAERLARSAGFLSMPPVPNELFLKCCRLAVGLNAEYVPPQSTGTSMYIRPLLFGSCPQLGLSPPEEYIFCVYVMPTGVYHGTHPVNALILEDFDRAAPKGTGTAKIGGNYAPVYKWSDKARSEGFDITLHLDSQTRSEIDEFSTSGFVGIKEEADGYSLAVPTSKTAIKSVTAESVIEIAKSFGWKVERRAVKYEELSSFTEVIACGTAAALVPIKSITMKSKNEKFLYQGGSDEPGPACLKLTTTLKGIQQGKIKDSFGWLDYVPEPKDFASGATPDGPDTMNGVDGNVDKLP